MRLKSQDIGNFTKREKEIVEKVVQILIHQFSPEKIILFGSRAKGIAHTGSDFDFAIDIEKPGTREERKVMEAIEKISGLYQVDVVYLNSVAEDFRNLILKTGKIVYERRD